MNLEHAKIGTAVIAQKTRRGALIVSGSFGLFEGNSMNQRDV